VRRAADGIGAGWRTATAEIIPIGTSESSPFDPGSSKLIHDQIDPIASMRRFFRVKRMDTIQIICQVTVGLGIINVWFLRRKSATPYRGGNAKNLEEEFAAYGLPPFALWAVGAVKVAAAIALLVGVYIPSIVQPAAIVVALLMLGAVAMHAKVHDPIERFLPAAAMLVLSIAVAAIEAI
jgi:uncharacterized membrane protein YphA (DoxX/SURF4 family)